MSNYQDIMIDLETADTMHSSKILSIGAVEFDRATGETGKELYGSFGIDTGLNAFRTKNTVQYIGGNLSTMGWWASQKQSVQDKAFAGTHDLQHFLDVELREFFSSRHQKVWALGDLFDIGILQDAYKQMAIELERGEAHYADYPWNFWNVRDVRTIEDACKGFIGRSPKPKDLHDPIVDCKWQIGYLVPMLNFIRGA